MDISEIAGKENSISLKVDYFAHLSLQIIF